MSRVCAIILAGGSGERFSVGKPKQFLKLAGKPIIQHTVSVFERNDQIDEIIVVTNPNYIEEINSILESFSKVSKIVPGGTTRMESSYNGLSALDKTTEKVLIHDAVRPFVTDRIIADCISALNVYSAADVAIPSSDTIIEVDQSVIESIPQRDRLMRGQTPQAFLFKDILNVHLKAKEQNFLNVTDDCGLFRNFSDKPIFVVNGEQSNIKITYQEDMVLADNLFKMKLSDVAPISLDQNLREKVIVIFGGTSGIGEQMSVLSEAKGSKVYNFGKSSGLDITDSLQVKEALLSVFEKERKIDFIVNSAAVLNTGKLIDRSYESIEEEVRVNYMGNVFVARESFQYLSKSSGSLLLFTSSSFTRGRENYSIYSSTKAAVVNLSQALAEEFYSDKVRVNVMCPERTKTPMRLKNFGTEPEGSLLCPEVAAKKSLEVLCSDMTGQVIEVKRK